MTFCKIYVIINVINYERNDVMKKKFISMVIVTISALAMMIPSVNAAESWRDPFVTRLMKIISQDPSYTDVVLTDLDRNGIPEAFTVRKGTFGGIGSGFTMVNNVITEINVPQNIIGECLENINVYIKNDTYVFVGEEVPRYGSYIAYYKLELNDLKLTATKILKTDVSPYAHVTYVDKYSGNLTENGYPNRTKITDFLESYDMVNNISAVHTTSTILVNGERVALNGYNVNDSNYFKIRDVAMALRNTAKKFNVEWDDADEAIKLLPGEDYIVVGGELSQDTQTDFTVTESKTPIYVGERQTAITAYNINGSSYFRIRDIGDSVGFEVEWDEASQAINIITN